MGCSCVAWVERCLAGCIIGRRSHGRRCTTCRGWSETEYRVACRRGTPACRSAAVALGSTALGCTARVIDGVNACTARAASHDGDAAGLTGRIRCGIDGRGRTRRRSVQTGVAARARRTARGGAARDIEAGVRVDGVADLLSGVRRCRSHDRQRAVLLDRVPDEVDRLLRRRSVVGLCSAEALDDVGGSVARCDGTSNVFPGHHDIRAAGSVGIHRGRRRRVRLRWRWRLGRLGSSPDELVDERLGRVDDLVSDDVEPPGNSACEVPGGHRRVFDVPGDELGVVAGVGRAGWRLARRRGITESAPDNRSGRRARSRRAPQRLGQWIASIAGCRRRTLQRRVTLDAGERVAVGPAGEQLLVADAEVIGVGLDRLAIETRAQRLLGGEPGGGPDGDIDHDLTLE